MYVCVSFVHTYTIDPIAVKPWEVVERAPAKVFGILHRIMRTHYYWYFYNSIYDFNGEKMISYFTHSLADQRPDKSAGPGDSKFPWCTV